MTNKEYRGMPVTATCGPANRFLMVETPSNGGWAIVDQVRGIVSSPMSVFTGRSDALKALAYICNETLRREGASIQ